MFGLDLDTVILDKATVSSRHYVSDIYIYMSEILNQTVRFFNCQLFALPSTGFELTQLIHCKTNHLALRPAP